MECYSTGCSEEQKGKTESYLKEKSEEKNKIYKSKKHIQWYFETSKTGNMEGVWGKIQKSYTQKNKTNFLSAVNAWEKEKESTQEW